MLLLLRLLLISTLVDPLSPSDLFVFYSELSYILSLNSTNNILIKTILYIMV